jgi:polysaccharide biosynthesis/export protein
MRSSNGRVLDLALTGLLMLAVPLGAEDRQQAAQPPVQTAAQQAAAEGAVVVGTPDYRIGPEDMLDIVTWKNADLTKTVQVRPDGKISLPLVNDVQAAGLTPMQLRAALTKGFQKYFTDPEVAVIVKEVHSIKISVVGAVKTPGMFEVGSQITVLEALAKAGGLTDFAKRDQIVVLRRNGQIPFNYSKITDRADPQANFLLESGDIVFVP